MKQPYACRTHEEMREVLMDPDATGPAIHYYMMRGGPDKTNITVMESGLIGQEYHKTYGHYHVVEFKETYNIIQGEGILLLQEREKDASGVPLDDRIASFRAMRVSAGSSITIPLFMGHLLVNTGATWLVTSDDSLFARSDDSAGMPSHADYGAVRKMRGFAYYVVDRDGRPALVKNPRYASVPEAAIG